MELRLLWTHYVGWTSSRAMLVHASIPINALLTHLILRCVCMPSITFLLLEIFVSRWKIFWTLNAMRSFIWMNRSHIEASRLALSDVSWWLICHLRATLINHLHWKVVSFCFCRLLMTIAILTTKKVLIVLTLNDFLRERLVSIIALVNLLDLHDVVLDLLEVFLSKFFVFM